VAQRDLIRQAAKKAGINTDRENFRIVSETVAAAIECIMESSEKCGNIAVFDLGGSSLSVAVLYFEKEPESDQSIISQLNVIVNEGFPNLGGVDWDKVVQEEIVRQLEENGVTAITDKMRHRLALASEQAKIDLTDSDLELYPIIVGNEGLEFDYAQSQFEADTSHLLNQALDHLEKVLGDFRIRATMRDIPEEILGIVLVGGSSNMPQVKKGIEDRFPQFAGKVAVRDPSFAVVKGAAHYCKMVGRKSS
jgi:molecular chaperone HscA